jgi:hypothetical protein
MKTTLILVLLFLGAMLVGCAQLTDTGSGNVVTHEEAITGFDRLDISEGFNVDISQGDEFSVVIRVDDNFEEYLQVGKDSDATLQAEITMPELVGLDLSGGSRASVSGSGEDIAIDASGGSGADLASFNVMNANVDASGGSQVTVNVSGTLNVDASGGSQVSYLGNPTLGVIDTSGGAQVLSK